MAGYEHVHMTSDDKYMVIHLTESWKMFPRCHTQTFIDANNPTHHVHGNGHHYTRENDYSGLFSQYQIKTISHKLTPNYSQGNEIAIIDSNHATNNVDRNLPNYEMFVVPAAHQDSDNTLQSLDGPQLDYWLNTTMRKGRRILPSRTQYFKAMKPTVVKYGAAQGKEHTNEAAIYMGRPGWYETTLPEAGKLDETAVEHYTLTLLIRKVDGTAMDENALYGSSGLSFRLDSTINFCCRATPKDGLTRLISPDWL